MMVQYFYDNRVCDYKRACGSNQTARTYIFSDLEGLDRFSPALEELILDNNQIDDSTVFPELPHVTLLSLSKNNVSYSMPLQGIW